MTSATMTHKKSRAVQPGEGESYWQPLPANGFVELALTQADNTNGPGFDVGIQEVAPDCSVREHVHDHHEEVNIVLEVDVTVTVVPLLAYVASAIPPVRPRMNVLSSETTVVESIIV